MTTSEELRNATLLLNAAASELESLQNERELRITQLAAISTASIQNTETSKKDRIDSSNPYYSTAYADVCVAVDREIRERNRAESFQRVNDQNAHDFKQLRCALNCDGSDLPQLLSAIEALQKENAELNKALALKLDAMPSGLSAGQSMKLDEELNQLRAEVAALQRNYNEEKEIVNRVWAALGCKTYEDAKGKAIDELVAELQRDKERLEWAIENHVLRFPRFSKDDGNFVNFTLLTSRHAIDAAMQEKP